ncbi:MAG: Gfo/Idh/MocA family oxidoreductase [Chloroflexi bacterium]|nr:Gfo/Idh/MocA family oxidoreductase [Chloroflexota bacterium]
MDPVGIGIIGSGYMARTYAQVLAQHARGATLRAVAVGRRAAGLAEEYRVAYAESLEALLARDDVAAVILATPEQFRLPQVRAAAAAGKHILSEKPLAPTVADAQAMRAAAAAAGVNLMVCHTARYRGTFARAHALVADGTVGRVRQMRSYAMGTLADFRAFVDEKPWIADPAGGGFFFDQAVHNFDFMRYLTGSEARQVFAFVTTQSDAPWPGMSVMAQVGFANGAMAQLNLCFELPDCLFPEQTFRFEVVAEHGLLDFDMYTSVRLGQRGAWTTVWSQPSFDFVNDPNSPIRLEAHAAMLQEFIDSVRERRRPAITADDGIAAVALCEACLRSARTGAVVHLE